MVTYYINTWGFTQPFQIFQSDGTTVYDITGLTVKWLFKNNNVTPATTMSLTGTITDAPNGKVSFLVTQNFFSIVATWDCQIQLSSASLLIQTDPPFVVDIIQSET